MNGVPDGSRHEPTCVHVDDADELDALATLSDEHRELVVARTCGFGNGEPGERAAVRRLVARRRADLLGRALALAPSAEGRVYALAGLSELHAIGDSDLARELRAITTPVRVCSGCIVSSTSAEKAIEYYDDWGPAISD